MRPADYRFCVPRRSSISPARTFFAHVGAHLVCVRGSLEGLGGLLERVHLAWSEHADFEERLNPVIAELSIELHFDQASQIFRHGAAAQAVTEILLDSVHEL